MNTPQRTRGGLPRLNAIAATVLATFGMAAGLAGSGMATAAGHVRANHDPFNAAMRTSPTGEMNRKAMGNIQRTSLAPRPSSTLTVANCNNDGAGSLRQALSDAASGDTIDLTALNCSKITLTSGELTTNGGTLTLVGPGRDKLAIDGNGTSRVLSHAGPLTIQGLTLRNGFNSSGIGGCLYMNGDLLFKDSAVTGCKSGDGTNGNAYGAGLDVFGKVTLENSIVSGNTAKAVNNSLGGGIYGVSVYLDEGSLVSGNVTTSTNLRACGGGIAARSGIGVQNSTIRDNQALAVDGSAYGGGIHSDGDGAGISITGSIVSGNLAHSDSKSSHGGGINSGDGQHDPSSTLILFSSTVSGNTVSAGCSSCFVQGGGASTFGQMLAKYSSITGNQTIASGNAGASGGGLASLHSGSGNAIALRLSTVSGNSVSHNAAGSGSSYGGGIAAALGSIGSSNSTIAFNKAGAQGGGIVASTGISLNDTIVAMNSALAGADIDRPPSNGGGALTITGGHNLVMTASANIVLPGDTINSSPRLFPLDYNGGSTMTHALAACSPAIDKGSNTSGSATDQRRGAYIREYGMAPDIGAFELQPESDLLFRNGFQGGVSCP